MLARLLFPVVIFLGAFLLFVSEPIAARQLLPLFGGSAAVWMTCLVFFQVALLLGYLYAHLLSQGSAKWHFVLLAAACVSAVAWAFGTRPIHAEAGPVAGIFPSLAATIGLPFVLLASTSPLLQAWFARHEGSALPYRFFALSNAASLLALLSYPTLIEPRLTLAVQRRLWSAAVLVFVLLSAIIAAQIPAVRFSAAASPGAQSRRGGLLTVLLPMAAAMQLSAVTAHLTSNIAAIPLLWIAPLTVYLLTFIFAFEFPSLARFRTQLLGLLAVALLGLGYTLQQPDSWLPIAISIPFFLAATFVVCLFCHAETFALRPQSSGQNTSQTTFFYLTIAAGGAAGSFLIGIVFPTLFRGNYDLALTSLATALLALATVWNAGWAQRLLWAGGSALLVLLVVTIEHQYFRSTLVATRNFYGSLRVVSSVTERGDPMRQLMNGSIQHGTQIFSPDLVGVPTTYYAPDSGIGLALDHCCAERPRRVGIIGLGAGTLAAYGRPGDTFRFYEINPAVSPLARNFFTWLRESKARVEIVEGDARSSLTAEPPEHFDVLAIDAFSGDAIPLHLLTTQALAEYRRHLAPGGVLAFHTSNRFVDLPPEIALLAQSAGLESRLVESGADAQSGKFRAIWVLVADGKSSLFAEPAFAARSRTIAVPANLRPWTDDYSSLLPVLRWRLFAPQT